MVDIYLNYDCDLSLQNIFERLVGDLSRLAQGRQAVALGATPQQEKMLRVKGMYINCGILVCIDVFEHCLFGILVCIDVFEHGLFGILVCIDVFEHCLLFNKC